MKEFWFFLNCLFIYSYVHMLFGTSLPPATCPHPLFPTPLASRQNLFWPLHWFCFRENIRDNKKDIALLLAWDKDSYTKRFLALLPCTCCITTQIGSPLPDLFTTSQSRSHSGLCQFKITLFTPLQWACQTLSTFGFPTFPYSSCTHSPLSVWPMSNNIIAFVLGLKSTNEGEYMIFGLLSLA
jgi:hypothetical protein